MLLFFDTAAQRHINSARRQLLQNQPKIASLARTTKLCKLVAVKQAPYVKGSFPYIRRDVRYGEKYVSTYP